MEATEQRICLGCRQPIKRQGRVHIRVKSRIYGPRHIPVATIRYFKAEDKYVLIDTTTPHEGSDLYINETIKDLEIEFNSMFMRIRNGTLIAVTCFEGIGLAGISKWKVDDHYAKLKGGGQLMISRRFLPSVKKFFA